MREELQTLNSHLGVIAGVVTSIPKLTRWLPWVILAITLFAPAGSDTVERAASVLLNQIAQ